MKVGALEVTVSVYNNSHYQENFSLYQPALAMSLLLLSLCLQILALERALSAEFSKNWI